MQKEKNCSKKATSPLGSDVAIVRQPSSTYVQAMAKNNGTMNIAKTPVATRAGMMAASCPETW